MNDSRSAPSDRDTPLFIGAWVLAQREFARFYRQVHRVTGALLQPLLFWMLLGFGFNPTFRDPARGESYLEYAYPGIVILTILFTSIFATISIIEDRREGFLQGVLVAPVSRLSIVLGKVFGATAIALCQAVLYLALAPLAGVPLAPAAFALAFVLLAAISVSLASLGFMLAWRLDSTQGFHAIMNVFLIPLWLLSGAFFPVGGQPRPLELTMQLNPLTYGVRAFRDALHGQSTMSTTFGFDCAITFGTMVLLLGLATRVANRTDRR